MIRPFAILLAVGLLGAAEGCHHTHGVCDCDPGSIGHEGPPPPLAMALPPLRPEPIAVMPKPAEPVAFMPKPAENDVPAPATAETPK
jgi:hypothetical protein